MNLLSQGGFKSRAICDMILLNVHSKCFFSNFTREQLNKASRPVGNVCLMDHTRRITELLAQINMFQVGTYSHC